MCDFRTAYNWDRGKPVPAGKETANTYEYVINKKGQKILEKTGEQNIYEAIQEELPTVLIENILAEAAVGDMTHFRPDGIYADISNAPSSLIEAQQQLQELSNLWNSLSPEIKSHYNYDEGEFVAASGNKQWLEDVGLLAEVDTTVNHTTDTAVVQPLGQINSAADAKESEVKNEQKQ